MVVRLKRNDYRPPALQHRFRAEGDLLPAKKKIAFLHFPEEGTPALKRELTEYKQVNAQVIQDCLQRLDDAFRRFFNGLAGYLRYKNTILY
jgi:hypothetical protein